MIDYTKLGPVWKYHYGFWQQYDNLIIVEAELPILPIGFKCVEKPKFYYWPGQARPYFGWIKIK